MKLPRTFRPGIPPEQFFDEVGEYFSEWDSGYHWIDETSIDEFIDVFRLESDSLRQAISAPATYAERTGGFGSFDFADTEEASQFQPTTCCQCGIASLVCAIRVAGGIPFYSTSGLNLSVGGQFPEVRFFADIELADRLFGLAEQHQLDTGHSVWEWDAPEDPSLVRDGFVISGRPGVAVVRTLALAIARSATDSLESAGGLTLADLGSDTGLEVPPEFLAEAARRHRG